jgi:hypothetical protein
MIEPQNPDQIIADLASRWSSALSLLNQTIPPIKRTPDDFAIIHAILAGLRSGPHACTSIAELQNSYISPATSEWSLAIACTVSTSSTPWTRLSLNEDIAYALRWIELATGHTICLTSPLDPHSRRLIEEWSA